METTNMAIDRPRVDARIESLDLLRGVALLGVMLMNIPIMGNVFSVSFPPLPFDWDSPDWRVYLFAKLTTDGTARGLFNMLFGVGVILITSRDGSFERPISTADIYIRRCLTLILLGLVNITLFLWPGDILFIYGMSGLVLFSLRKLKPWTLVCVAVVFLGLCNSGLLIKSINLEATMAVAASAEKLKADGKTLTAEQAKAIEVKAEYLNSLSPDAETRAEESKTRLSRDFGTLIRWSFTAWMEEQGSGMALYGGMAESGGFMLIGMALFKWRILTAERSVPFYAGLAILSYAIGMGLRLWRLNVGVTENFSIPHWWIVAIFEPARLFVTLGHIGLILSLYKLHLLEWLATGFAALGRMALTNYLGQSLITSILFYGAGLYGRFQWADLWLIGLGIVGTQIIFSLVWLKAFQFGPAEWLLRTISYCRWQPMLKARHLWTPRHKPKC